MAFYSGKWRVLQRAINSVHSRVTRQPPLTQAKRLFLSLEIRSSYALLEYVYFKLLLGKFTEKYISRDKTREAYTAGLNLIRMAQLRSTGKLILS